MQSRLPWILSFGLNAALLLAVAGLWSMNRHAPDRPPSQRAAATTAGAAANGGPLALRSDSTSVNDSSTNAPAPVRFHWSEIESNDYRQYIARLRAVGCPDRLIRDLVVAELDQLYERRRQSVRSPPLPPWATADTRAAAEADQRLRLAALDEEHRAAVRELLGFAWNREALELWNNEQLAWVLLGFLTDDQAVQVAGLVEPLTDNARRLKDRVDGILLTEDLAALEQLRAQFRADVATVLTPQQTEEFDLRLQALGLALSGRSLHFETAGLTAWEVREVVRLSLVQADFVREELLNLEIPDEEQEARKLAFEAGVARLLGPQRYPAFARAQDERFREAYEFSRERQLPPDVAIKAWEIRREAEAAATALRAAPAGLGEAQAVQPQLQALQEAAAAALTTLFGAGHMSQYVEHHGDWLNQLDPAPDAGAPGEAE